MAGRRAASKNQASARPSEETSRALQERVKELSCLYRINQIFETYTGSPHEVFQRIVELIPPAWQYPGIASARIVLDGRQYETPGFREARQRQTSDVILGGKSRGSVEVVYPREKLPRDDVAFLKEEQSLLDAIARQIAFIVERQQAKEERDQLQKQLMHADRLATIGQLAAGVAHELNEPLNSILGFAQLAQRNPRLSKETMHDIQRIVTASLHARSLSGNPLRRSHFRIVVPPRIHVSPLICASQVKPRKYRLDFFAGAGLKDSLCHFRHQATAEQLQKVVHQADQVPLG